MRKLKLGLNRPTFIVALLSIGCIVASLSSALSQINDRTKELEKGEYLVTGVGMCIDCHGENLKGQKLPFKPIEEGMLFVPFAPSIRGEDLKHYTEAQLVQALMTGKRPNDTPFLPPMPHYKMNKDDAQAVVRYIKSLK